jgi:AcrR family transcriptional regulator
MDQSVRDRILRSAAALFYQQGYQGTGINQIIADARVAKASFFSHFPSKDVLLVAYARGLLHQDQHLRQAVETWGNPRDRFFAAFRILKPWLSATNFRGCPFQNLSRESHQLAGVQQAISEHHENLRILFGDVTDYLIVHERAHRRANRDEIAYTYQLLFEGAISSASSCRTTRPVLDAISAMTDYVRAKMV